jgi:hypothetical protein
MSRIVSVCLRVIVVLAALTGTPLFHPAPVLAASGTLSMETPLHDSPDPAAPVIALLAAGSTVSIDGPPVDGFYPVTASDLSGWMRGESLQIEKDTPEPAVVEETEIDPLGDDTGGTVPVEASPALDPATDPVTSTTVDSASDPVADTSAATEEALPASESATEEGVMPVREPVPEDEPTLNDGADAPPAPELDNTDTLVPVAPDGGLPPPETASTAPEAAAEPTTDPDATSIPAAEVSPVGPASVTVDAPILAGPGPEYGFIATATAGSTVEKTGHLINGYATVQYGGVTGWLALEHLGAPSTPVEETSPAETATPTETLPADEPPAETSPTKTASSETPLAEAEPSETPPAETPPGETAPIEAAPVDAAPTEVAPVAAA